MILERCSVETRERRIPLGTATREPAASNEDPQCRQRMRPISQSLRTEPTTRDLTMSKVELPPGQHERRDILRWNIDHPGIIPTNPQVDLKRWKLTVDGEVAKPCTFTWEQFLNLSATESTNDFHCVEGWSVRNCRWLGVRFNTLLDLVKPKGDAKHVTFRCSDGYTTSLSLEELSSEDVLLAYKLNNKPLETALGGPMRLVVPSKYAYKSAMWVEQITFTKKKEMGFWERRGYSDTADVWSNDRFSQ